MNPKISVIFPVYNVEYYLEEALDSIKNQTFINNIEVLMIDDGSTDNSRYIIEKYALDYDNFYAFHKENEGLCSARNFGLTKAKGEYIHFLDSDDFIIPNFYEKLYEIASKDDYDIITTNYLRFNSKYSWRPLIASEVFKENYAPLGKTNLYQYNELSWDMPACTKIIKREFLEENNIQFYHKNILHEDNLFMINAYVEADKVGILNEDLYFWRYREIGTSITQEPSIKKGKRLYEMIYLVNNYLNENIKDKTMLNKKYNKLLTIDLFYFIQTIPKNSKENQEVLFEILYDIISLIPQEYIENLNSHLKTLYTLVRIKDWDNFILIASDKFKRIPELPENLNPEYANKIDFQKDSHSEKLISQVNSVECNNKFIIIDFQAYVPYNKDNNFDKISFRLVDEKQKDSNIDPENIKDNKLHIPIELINFGENSLITTYYYDNITKENYLTTQFTKTFIFDEFDITIKRGKTSNLRLIKREKNNIQLKITNIELKDDEFHLSGYSNKKIENIALNDYFDFARFKYPIKYLSNENNEFIITVKYDDFLKSPIKKWEITSDETFNKINLTRKYEFANNNYLIHIFNQHNKINIEFELYDPLEKIKELNSEIDLLINKNNDLNKDNNKLIHDNTEMINSLIDINSKLNRKTDIFIKNSYNNKNNSFYDEGIIRNKNDSWYDPGNNVIVKSDENGTVLTNETNFTSLYLANKQKSQLGWTNTFNWYAPYIIEVYIINYSNDVAFRITDENGEEITIPFINLGITKNNFIKIINNGSTVRFYRDNIPITHETISKKIKKCQIGFRIVNGHVKYNNFKIY